MALVIDIFWKTIIGFIVSRIKDVNFPIDYSHKSSIGWEREENCREKGTFRRNTCRCCTISFKSLVAFTVILVLSHHDNRETTGERGMGR